MKCVVCRHCETRPGTTTVTLGRDGLTLVVTAASAQVCANCGEDSVDDAVAREIMSMAEEISRTGAVVDVRRYVPGSAAC